jgi:Rod binding domain-containing protein
MSSPIALGGPALPPAPINDVRQDRGANALSARTSPPNRLPVIDRSKVDPNTVKAAEGMEAMFLDYMMQEMRRTVPKNDMDLESPATDIYRGMLDSETARKSAHAGGIGLADQIIAYLESQRYTGPSGSGAHGVPLTRQKDLSTGGTHASQPDKQ